MYQFRWRKNIWSQFHAPQPEIRDYLQTVARENDWYRLINFRHEVVRASWTDEEAKWTLNIHDIAKGFNFDDKVDLFVELNGCVSNPQITVPGIEAFKGRVVHPGDWPKDLDLKDKRVGLLGYGSSGVQIAPNILPSVSKLYTWFRSRAYMLPSPYQDLLYDNQGTNFFYNEKQKEMLQDPDIYLAYSKLLDDGSNRRFDMMVNGSENSARVKEMIKAYMQEKLKPKPGLYDMIVPIDYDFACRRPTMCMGKSERSPGGKRSKS